MSSTWQAMATGIALQPVPPEMARCVHLLCVDCEERDENRRWHFLGIRCNKCGSFNTTVEQTVMQGLEAATFLDQIGEATSSEETPTMYGVPLNVDDPMDMNADDDL